MEEKNKKKIIQNKKPSDVFGETILISDNTNFSCEVSKFISKLEEKYSIYIQETEELEKKWKEFKDKDSNETKNVYIESERMSTKSPTTILNAPWGTGKTHFIEEIALNWNNDVKKSRKTFKNFIVVDTWRFLTSPNVLNSLILEIYNVLYKTLNKKETKQNSKKWWEKIKKIVGFILPWTPMIFGAIGEIINPNSGLLEVGILGSEFAKETKKSQEKDKDQTTAEDLLNEVNSLIEPTIIVFDNIERMGIHSWEIIKTIQRLSVFKNLLFLLPLNKSQLKFDNDFEHQKKNESSIDKYITLGTYFDLRQDYVGVLKTMDFEKQTIDLINNILNEEIDGYKLSIRLIKYSFETYKIKKSFDINKYYGLRKIKEIWNANLIYYVIESDFDELNKDFDELNEYFNKLNDIFKNKINFDYNTVNNLSNLIKYNENFNNLKLIIEELDFYEINDKYIESNYNFLKNISYKSLEEWNNYIVRLNKFKNDLNIESSEMSKKIESNKKYISKIERNNIEINKKINEYERKIEEIENKPNNSSKDAEDKVNFENHLISQKKSIEKNLNNISELNENNSIIKEVLDEIKKLINNGENSYLNNFIDNFSDFYNKFKIKLDSLLENKDKKVLYSILDKKVNELIENDREYYNKKILQNSVFDDEYTKDIVINELLGIDE